MSLTAENVTHKNDVEIEAEVEIVDEFPNETEGVALSLRDLTSMILDNPHVKQGIVILITDNDDHTEFKGHFYDNAALMSGILKDYKAKIFSEIFSDRED